MGNGDIMTLAVSKTVIPLVQQELSIVEIIIK